MNSLYLFQIVLKLFPYTGTCKGKCPFLHHVISYTQENKFRPAPLPTDKLGFANSCLPFKNEKEYHGVLSLVVVRGICYQL